MATPARVSASKVAASSKGLNATTISGLSWLMFQSGGLRLISILSQLILARILVPSQFGLISIVYGITMISAAAVNFGIDGVLLQRSRTMHLWLTSSFWASLVLGLAGFLIVIIAAAVISAVRHSEQLFAMTIVAALSMPLGALGMIPSVRLRSEMNFRFPAIYSTVETAVSQLTTIVLAIIGFGAWSFVAPTPVIVAVRVSVFWFYKPSALRSRVRLTQVRYIVSNGLAILGSRVAIEMISQGDYITLGFLASQSAAGLYYFAFRLSVQPIAVLAGNFNNVLFPALVQMRTSPERQLRTAIRAAEILEYVTIPVCYLQAVLVGPLLRLFFGHKWDGSVIIAQLLSIGLAFDGATWVSGSLFNARREYRLGLLLNAFRLPTFFGLVILGGLLDKQVGVAIGVATYHLIHGPVVCYVTFSRYGGRFRDVLAIYLKPLILTVIAMGPAYVLSNTSSSPVVSIILAGTVGALLYSLLVRWLSPGIFTELGNRLGITARFRRLLPRVAHATTPKDES